MEEKGLSNTEGGKEGKLKRMQQKRRSGPCKQRGDIRSGFESETEAAGSRGEGEKEEVRCEVLHRQEKLCLVAVLQEGWCQEAVEDGLGTCESVGTTGRWHVAHRKVEVEAADGGSSRQGRVCLAISFRGGE